MSLAAEVRFETSSELRAEEIEHQGVESRGEEHGTSSKQSDPVPRLNVLNRSPYCEALISVIIHHNNPRHIEWHVATYHENYKPYKSSGC